MESGRVKTPHNITLYSRKLCCYLNMIQKSVYESSQLKGNLLSSWKDSYHVKLLTYLQGRSCHFGKHGFNGEDYTIGLSAQEVIPMVSGNTADIFSLWISHFLGLWFRDHFHWWTNTSILKENSALLWKELSLSPFTEASLRVGVLS